MGNFVLDLIKESEDREKFCILPFVSMQIFGDQISPCCKCTVNHFNTGLSWSESFSKYLHNSNLLYKQSRFLSNSPSEDCDRCFLDSGVALYPSNKLREYKKTLGDELPIKSKIDRTTIQILNLTISGTCNLQCRHCSPHLSSSLAKIWDDELIELTNFLKNNNIPKDDTLLDEIIMNPIFDNVAAITIGGGEPLMHAKLKELILNFKNKGTKRIGVVSNAYSDPFDFLDFFDELEGLTKIFTVSIDGGQQMHSYYRNLKDITSFESNCKKVARSKTITPMVLISVSAINIYEIPNAIYYSYELFGDCDLFLNLSIVENPYLDISVLPVSERKNIIDFYNDSINSFKYPNALNANVAKELLLKVRLYVERSMSKEYESYKLSTFSKYIKKLDAIHLTDFNDVNPRIGKLIDEYYLRACASNTSEAEQKELPQVVQFFPRA